MSGKKWQKLCRSKLAFKQVIAVYIIQNKTMVVFLELFKEGKLFRDTWYE